MPAPKYPLTATLFLVLAALAGVRPVHAGAPSRLSETGLYRDISTRRVDERNLPYSPQYPLWTDGATKERWISLPKGSWIDASRPDAWVFPVGTRLWKEFRFSGRAVETRYMELESDGTWLYATYVWNLAQTDADLAPERGVRAAAEIQPGVAHDVPGKYDCLSCHAGGAVAVLGFGALQLSPDRDPLAPHREPVEPGDVDLGELIARGWVRGLPREMLGTPPRIDALTPLERAALGYLHANCGHCHNASGALSELGLSLAVETQGRHRGDSGVDRTAVNREANYRLAGGPALLRLDPGAPQRSLVALRAGSRNGLVQMPPLGTRLVDEPALALLSQWIEEKLVTGISVRSTDKRR